MGLRYPASWLKYCGCLRFGNCHVAFRRLPETIYTEEKKEAFFHRHHYTLSAPPHLPVCSLFLFGNCIIMLIWPHKQSPIHRPELRASLPPLFLGTSPSFGLWGILLTTCTPVIFFRTGRSLTQFRMVYIYHCPFHGFLETQLMYCFLYTAGSSGCHKRD